MCLRANLGEAFSQLRLNLNALSSVKLKKKKTYLAQHTSQMLTDGEYP